MSAPVETAPSAPLTLDNLDITTTELYVKYGYPWEAWDLLRREAPVFWYERPGFEPFWAITKYNDMAWISRNPQTFSNRQRLRPPLRNTRTPPSVKYSFFVTPSRCSASTPVWLFCFSD